MERDKPRELPKRFTKYQKALLAMLPEEKREEAKQIMEKEAKP